jgi:hypothetical protein
MSKEELERQCRNKGLLTNGSIATLRRRLTELSANDYKLQYLKDRCKENHVSDKGTKQQLYERWKASEDEVPIHKRVIQEKEYKKIVDGKDLVIPDHIRVLHFVGPVKGTFKVPNFVTDVILKNTSSSSIKTNDTQRRHIFMTMDEFYVKSGDVERAVDRAAKDKRNRFYVTGFTDLDEFRQHVMFFYAVRDGVGSNVVKPHVPSGRIFKIKETSVPLNIQSSEDVTDDDTKSSDDSGDQEYGQFRTIHDRLIRKKTYRRITDGRDLDIPHCITVLHFDGPVKDTFVVPEFVKDVILEDTPSYSIITNDNQRRHVFITSHQFYIKSGYKEREVDRSAQDERNRFYVSQYIELDELKRQVRGYAVRDGQIARVVPPDVPRDRLFTFKGYSVPLNLK